MSEVRSGFWMVWCEGGGVQSVPHSSYEAADREAQRLARNHPGRTFYVHPFAEAA